MAEQALQRRLRRLLLQLKAEFDPVSATYETTACALDGLEAALDVDFPYSKRKRKYAGKRTVAAVSAGGVRKLGWTWLGCCMTFTRSTTAAVAEPPGSMTLTRSTTAAAAETPGSLCADLSLTFRILNTAALTIIAIACLVWLRTPRPTPPSRAMTPTPPPTDAGDQPDSSASAGAAAAAPDGSASAGGVQPDGSSSAGDENRDCDDGHETRDEKQHLVQHFYTTPGGSCMHASRSCRALVGCSNVKTRTFCKHCAADVSAA